MTPPLRPGWSVAAVGDCGCDGGVFGVGYATRSPVWSVIEVDVALPGCPPVPIEILRGIPTAVRRFRITPAELAPRAQARDASRPRASSHQERPAGEALQNGQRSARRMRKILRIDIEGLLHHVLAAHRCVQDLIAEADPGRSRREVDVLLR